MVRSDGKIKKDWDELILIEGIKNIEFLKNFTINIIEMSVEQCDWAYLMYF